MRKYQWIFTLIMCVILVGGFTYSPTPPFQNQIIGTPVCWKSSSDINLIRYDLVSVSAKPGKVLFYVDAAGDRVNVPGGAILQNGWCCPCFGDSGGGSSGPDTSLYSMDGIIYEDRLAEIDSLIHTLEFRYNWVTEQYSMKLGYNIDVAADWMGAGFFYEKPGDGFGVVGTVGQFQAGSAIPRISFTEDGGSTTRFSANRGQAQMENSSVGIIEIDDDFGLRVYDERWRFGLDAPGLVYAFNHRAHFTDSTLIDKGYADSTLLNITGEIALPVFADDAAAGVGGLTSGDFYRTASGEVRIKL